MGSYALPPGLSAEGVSIPGLSQDALEERLLEARKTYKLNMGCVKHVIPLHPPRLLLLPILHRHPLEDCTRGISGQVPNLCCTHLG